MLLDIFHRKMTWLDKVKFLPAYCASIRAFHNIFSSPIFHFNLRCREENQSPVLEAFPFAPLLENDSENNGSNGADSSPSTQSNESAFRKRPLTQTSSIGQKAKDVLSRQSSSASERINGKPMFVNIFYSILFYPILFYSILFYSILFYSILFFSILFFSIQIYSIPFHSIPFYFYSFLFYLFIHIIIFTTLYCI